MYSFIVFKYVKYNLTERKIQFRENWLIFWGIWEEAELILRIWGAKESIFRELRNFLSGTWGDQCINFREQGSTDPFPWGPHKCQHILTGRRNCNIFFNLFTLAVTVNVLTLSVATHIISMSGLFTIASAMVIYVN